MRSRAAALAAVVAFFVAVAGIAVIAARSGDGSGLEPLAYSAGGGERADAALTMAAAGPVEYRLKGTLPDLPDEAAAYRVDSQAATTRAHAALGIDPTGAQPDIAVGVAVACPPEADCLPPAPVAGLPAKDDAERIARQAFGRLGIDAGRLELRGGTYSWEAVLVPEVDGVPVRGIETVLSVGVGGKVVGGYGFLGEPDRIGDYPLVGVQEGYARLTKGPELTSQIARDLPLRVITVTGARLSLLYVGDALLPVYEFLVDDGTWLTAPAVIDRWLVQRGHVTPAATPDDDPGPPSSGSGLCTGAAAAAAPGGDNAPMTVQVCVEPATARVGEEVAFRVTVADPDAEIHTDTCQGPEIEYGDEEHVVRTACLVACKAGQQKAARPGRYEHTYRHAYTRVGTFTARFAFRSGVCTSGSSAGEARVEVHVSE